MNWLLLLAQAEAPDVGAGGILAGGACVVVAAIVGLVAVVIWLWALVDAIKNPALDSTMRLIWILVLIFTGILGAIVYLLVGRAKTS